MKTIDERARELVEKAAVGQDVPDYINELLVECYCIAAMEERKLLTEWHDPEKELPTEGRDVLIKFRSPFGDGCVIYGVSCVNDAEWSTSVDILGWREIHE